MPTEAQPTQAPPPESPRSDPPLRITAGGMEVAVKGLQTANIAALAVYAYLGYQIAVPAFGAVKDLTAAMRETAGALTKIGADVAEVRAAQAQAADAQRKMEQRFDQRFEDLEKDLRSLRDDIRAARK